MPSAGPPASEGPVCEAFMQTREPNSECARNSRDLTCGRVSLLIWIVPVIILLIAASVGGISRGPLAGAARVHGSGVPGECQALRPAALLHHGAVFPAARWSFTAVWPRRSAPGTARLAGARGHAAVPPARGLLFPAE